MANALRELFGNIATAIRDKTGSAETMTPAEFPEKIGEIQVNTYEAVETTVELDFSEGDMVVVPEEGKLFEEVNILTPENLIPENIAEGVDIAGVIGTLAVGSNVKIAVVTSAYGATTVAHNLGVIPDVIIGAPISAVTAGSTAGRRVLSAFACSSAFGSVYPSIPAESCSWYQSSKWYTYTMTTYFDQDSTSYIKNVTETTFEPPSYIVGCVWFVIGGLT